MATVSLRERELIMANTAQVCTCNLSTAAKPLISHTAIIGKVLSISHNSDMLYIICLVMQLHPTYIELYKVA